MCIFIYNFYIYIYNYLGNDKEPCYVIWNNVYVYGTELLLYLKEV